MIARSPNLQDCSTSQHLQPLRDFLLKLTTKILLLSEFTLGFDCCSRVFPNDEMDQFATSVRQVARTLWTVHVTLQMGFEEEVLPGLSLLLPYLAVSHMCLCCRHPCRMGHSHSSSGNPSALLKHVALVHPACPGLPA